MSKEADALSQQAKYVVDRNRQASPLLNRFMSLLEKREKKLDQFWFTRSGEKLDEAKIERRTYDQIDKLLVEAAQNIASDELKEVPPTE